MGKIIDRFTSDALQASFLEVEVEDLQERVDNIRDFVHSDRFKEIPSEQKLVINTQFNAMCTYLSCLVCRLEDIS